MTTDDIQLTVMWRPIVKVEYQNTVTERPLTECQAVTTSLIPIHDPSHFDDIVTLEAQRITKALTRFVSGPGASEVEERMVLALQKLAKETP